MPAPDSSVTVPEIFPDRTVCAATEGLIASAMIADKIHWRQKLTHHRSLWAAFYTRGGLGRAASSLAV